MTKSAPSKAKADWIARMERLQKRIEQIYEENPPRLLKSFRSNAYWDGSFGPMRTVEIWDSTASDAVEQLFKDEFSRLRKSNAVVEAIFDED